jgi:hypothetical protein
MAPVSTPALTRMAPLCSGLSVFAGANRSTGIVTGTTIVYGSRIRAWFSGSLEAIQGGRLS